jgi:oligopeptide transport system substrate-binding protein
MSRLWKSTLIAALAALAMALPAMMATGRAEIVYNRGNDADPETLDPHKTGTVYEANILRDLFEGLTIHDAKGTVAPGVATSWSASDDGTVYTFKLRPDAKWSNGDQVKASDFVFSWRRMMNPATGAKYANILYPLLNAEKINKGQLKPDELGAKALDDLTLEVRLERPTPYFIELLTHQSALPVHPPSVEKFGSDFVKPGNMVSNGAYMLAEFVPNAQVKLVKNPYFHDAANVAIDTVVFQPQKDLAAAVRRYQAGELQSTSDIPADQIKFLKQQFGDQVKLAPYLGTYYLAVNTTKPPFNDVRVRQALSMVIDREFIADQIWGQTMVPAYSFVPPGINNYGEPAYADYKDMPPIEREEKAGALLKEAGYGPGLKPLKVEIRYNTTDNNKNTLVAVAENWKTLGVETTFVNTDAKTHFAYLREGGDFDAARAGWIGDYSDPQNFLFLVMSDNKGLNYARWKNPDYDALLDKAAAETDLKKRAEILFQAETLFMRELPYIPLLYYGSKNLVSPRLSGWSTNLRDAHATRFLSLKP